MRSSSFPETSRWIVIATLAASCSPSTGVPSGAQIACASDSQCPSGWRCDVAEGQCFDPAANRAPSVALGVVSPGGVGADVSFSVADPENDPVSLSFEVGQFSDGPFVNASTSSPTAGLSTRTGENMHLVTWDAVTDAGAWPVRNDLDTDGDGIAETPSVRFTSFYVRMQVQDGSGAASEPALLGGPFDLGNDPPELTLSSPVSMPAGAVVLGVQLSDSAGDLTDIEVEVRHDSLDAADTWRPATIVFGGTSDVIAPPDGVDVALVWQSDDDVGGIGERTLSGVEVRARASDEVAFGTWSGVTLSVSNQTPPRILALEAPRNVQAGGSTPVALIYEVADAESDLVDARFEYSIDRGRSFLPCDEYPNPQSEGFYSLTSNPGGMAHAFFWDATGVSWGRADTTQVRLTVSDRPGGESDPFLAILGVPIGPPDDVAAGAFLVPGESFDAMLQPQWVSVGHMNAGTVPDLVALGDNSYRVMFGTVTSGNFSFSGGTVTSLGLMPGNTAKKMKVADLDDDGDQDVVILTTTPDMFILRNNGSGAMTMTTFTLSDTMSDFELEDFTGDGLPDIVTSGRDLVVNVAALNLGTLSYAAAGAPLSLGPNVSFSLAIGDVTGGPEIDVVVAEDLGDRVSLFTVNPVGILAFDRDILVERGTTTPYVADFDGDGDDDIAVVNRSGDVSLFHQTGATFTYVGEFRVGSVIHAADLDSDGATDLVGIVDEDLVVGRGNGGGFSVSVQSGATTVGNPLVRSAFDIDGDGFVELAASSFLGSTVRIFWPRRELTASSSFFSPAVELYTLEMPEEILAVDYNSDGIVDLVVGGRTGLEIFYGEAKHRFAYGAFQESTLLDSTQGWRNTLIGDFDGDATADIVGYGPSGLSMLRGATQSVVTSAAGSLRSMAAGDLNGDGDLEVLLATPGGAFEAYDADGQGNFAILPTTLAPGFFLGDIALEDLDHDGDLDLITINQNAGGRVDTALRDSSITSPITFASFVASSCDLDGFVVADVNSDGDVDVVGSASQIGVCLGDGGGGFGAEQNYGAFAPERFVAADFTGDGALDIAGVQSLNGLGVAIANTPLGIPDATFPGGWTVPGESPAALIAADLDADTVVDLAVLDSDRAKITLHIGESVAARDRWTTTSSGGTAVELQGTAPDTGLDRFGSPVSPPRFGWHPVRGLGAVRDFAADLRAYRRALNLPAVVQTALAPPYLLTGDVRNARIDATTVVGQARLGARVTAEVYPGEGLDVFAGRAIRATLPLWAGIATSDVDGPEVVHVSVLTDGGTWEELNPTSGDVLTNGTGNRFSIQTPASGPLVIDILTDHGGVFLAWVTP